MIRLPVEQRPRKTTLRRLKAAARAVAPWLLSLVIHFAAVIVSGIWAAPAATGTLSHARAIELSGVFGEEMAAGQFAPAIAFPLSQVPSLIALPAPPSPAPAVTAPAASAAALPQAESALPYPVQPASYVPPTASASAPSAPPTLTQIFGVFARGTRFVYVFDRSASMEGRPLQAAKSELIASLADLTPRDRFQVIFYSDQPRPMTLGRTQGRALFVADELTKRLAARYVGGVLAEGSTHHFAALAAALDLQPDVIFFLTDSAGEQLTAEQLARLRQANRATAIYAIEFGAGPRPPAPSFLERLAMENAGQHTYIDISRLR